jgi:dTDP-4-amino-4,6-dideoxygalactose transaminase
MIPFLDLKAQYRSIKEEVDRAVLSVLESSQFVLGPEVAAFEDEFAAFSGAQHGIAVNSGTSALHLALLAAGVGPGDEVVTVPFTFVATVAAIRYIGAKPVFVDIDPRSFTMDPEAFSGAITHRTKAVLPVHLYGQPADMDPIAAIARRHGVAVIEDSAQAHGAEYKGRRAGSLGDLACFSFYPGKNLGAYGEGGIVITNDAEQARKIRMMRDWGQEQRYHHVLPGFNYRMEGIQGAVLRVKLRHLQAWTDARRQRAQAYDALLEGSAVTPPPEMPYARHAYHIYAVRSGSRDVLQQRLLERGVHTGLHYPIPVHLQPVHADLGYRSGQFPHSEAAAGEVLSLPLFPELPLSDVERVAEALVGAAAAAAPATVPARG